MITHAINSGAINAVPFPSSEVGASIIELIGTVQVVCEPVGITVRITIAATGAPKATLSANTTSRMLLGATTQASAAVSDIAARQKMKLGGATSGAATPAASLIALWRLCAATGQAAANSVATSYQLAKRSVNVTAQATTSASSVKYLYRSASIAGIAAVNSPDSRRKIAFAVSTLATAVAQSGRAIKSRLPATTTARALTQAQPLSYLSLRAISSAPSGLSQATAKLVMRIPPEAQTAGAVTALTNPRLRISPKAQGVALAAAQDSNATYRFRMSAGTVATAIASSTATDYATKIPAPSERQIVVPAYDRTMKVI